MFLHPWALGIGLAALGLPVLIHLLTRPRPTSLPLSTLKFVREAIRHRRARHRLRDAVVLALRTAAVLLIALAVARPRWVEQPLVSDEQAGEAVRVVLLDVSQSMAAAYRGAAALERGRAVAAEQLRYRPGLQANLILAAARPSAVFDRPSSNFELLRQELSQAAVLPQRLEVSRALLAAAEMLAPLSPDDPRRRELVIVSDFQRSSWARADFSLLPPETQIQLESVAPADPLPNLALLAARVRGRSVQGGEALLEVDVGNYTVSPQQVEVEVSLGEATYRLAGPCSPGRRTTLSQAISLRTAGWQWGQAKLLNVRDALPADDTCGLAVEVGGQPLYALLTRQPPQQRPSSSYFLEAALAPDVRLGERASAQVERIDPGQADRESLGRADLLVLEHPGKLQPGTVSLLAGLLRRGRPILYVACEPIDAVNLKLLADAAGSTLRMPVEFSPPAQATPRRNLFLASYRRDAAPFEVFGDRLPAVAGQLRFSGGLASRRSDAALEEDILATYSDGTACLVIAPAGAAALAVLNLDLNSSNLPADPAFVPLIEELVKALLQRRQEPDAICGEPLLARLPTANFHQELQAIPPGATAETAGEAIGEFLEEETGVVWNWPAASMPGTWRIQQGDQTLLALAVRLPEEESQLEWLPPDVLQGRLAAGRNTYYRAADRDTRNEDIFWNWLLLGCLTCLLVELAALTHFRT